MIGKTRAAQSAEASASHSVGVGVGVGVGVALALAVGEAVPAASVAPPLQAARPATRLTDPSVPTTSREKLRVAVTA
ncbi:hypothetical protein CTB96_03495 [Cryobacterium arcticum]|uniref:Uncharacterized protein n=1 Tax=Cryobacterium arcticum TaxID=670052 RepID=A0A317ZXD7_9MICO|nr:hypothetical protein CTB96_03495 [Cryobacterium arcticum]